MNAVLLAAAVVIAGAGASYLGMLFLAARRGRTCPLPCGAMLAYHPDRRLGAAAYACEKCGREWMSAGGGGLIPRAAWEAGAREPLPTATIVEREP